MCPSSPLEESVTLVNGWMWRYQVKNFDWDLPGQYACVRNISRTSEKYGNHTNVSEWMDIYYSRIGANGVFSSFSDPELTQFNVDFDFRNACDPRTSVSVV